MINPKQYFPIKHTIAAVQYDGTNAKEIAEWANSTFVYSGENGSLTVWFGETGQYLVPLVSDWIYADHKGKWYVLSDTEFRETYQPW